MAATTRAYRLCGSKHVAFDGAGARTSGGRWNRPGLAMVYTSQSESLALLEGLANLLPRQVPTGYVCICAEIPNTMIQDVGSLPASWRDRRDLSQRIGSDWIATRSSAVLRVPSAVLAREYNFLINPSHPDFANIRIDLPYEAEFDARLFRIT